MGDHAPGTTAKDQFHDLVGFEVCDSGRGEFYSDRALYDCRASAARCPGAISSVYFIPLAGLVGGCGIGFDVVEF